MLIKINKYNLIFLSLCIYFTTKMLWDTVIPNIFEFVSLLLLLYGAFLYFYTSKITKSTFGIVALYIIFSIYIVLNAAIQDNSQQFFRSIYEYIFYSSILFSCAYYLNRIQFENIVKILAFLGLIIALLSWYEYLTGSYIIGRFDASYTIGFRAAVFTRSYLSHGIVLGFFSIIDYYIYIFSRRKIYLILCIFSFVSILTTSSRGPIVAVFAALVIMYVLNYRRRNTSYTKRFCIIIFLLLLFLLIFLFLNSTVTTGNTDVDYFLYRIRQITNWTGDAGNVGRIRIWNRTFDLIRSSLLFGIGPSKTGSWGSGSIGVTESGILKHLCELGVVGFLIYYLFIINIIIKGIAANKFCNDKAHIEFICYIGLIIMILVNNITLQSTEEIMVSFIFWLGMGGLLSIYRSVSPSK